MSEDDKKPPSRQGRRKDGKPFKEDNVREDGSYEVGRNRPPKQHRFAAGDGRPRGQRKKGVRNTDTEFERELRRKVPVKENGKERTVTKSHAVDLRLIHNATRKGENRAIEMVDKRRQRIEEARLHNRHYHTLGDKQILEAYLQERAQELGIDPDLFGDPSPAEDIAEDRAEDGENGNG
jgi:hypothetical protein